MSDAEKQAPSNFIRTIVEEDKQAGKNDGKIVTRFPPEPNGYLHIGHAKSIALNFGIAADFAGVCHLRMDDTNPVKEDAEYVAAIHKDVEWLGFQWGQHEYYASDYFQRLYDCAVALIKDGKAYVDSLSGDEIREYRGTLKKPGRPSPHRDRSVEENLDLFEKMRGGDFQDGEHVLRAKIDMGSPNMNLRDPTLYRIRHAHHQRTGDDWCVYPMYDFAHALSDAIEGVTHSLCTLEFEDHRPLYDWVVAECKSSIGHIPRQIEFARLNLTNTVLSKRKLMRLVEDQHVGGWDDPRMPTISGMRRRGYTPASLRNFAEAVGVAKADSTVDFAMLEFFVRDDLNKSAPRRMSVLNPLKLVIENYPEGESEELEAKNNPEDESAGTRMLPFAREVYIERDDFKEDPPKKYHRLAPGRELRLQHAYYVKYVSHTTDDNGEVTEVRVTYDPATKGGWSEDGRKVKGTSHWVSAAHALKAEVRLYDHLFTKENPDDAPEGQDFTANLNPDSLTTVEALIEPSLKEAGAGDRIQFLRQGYYCVDPDSTQDRLVFNRTVSLKDSWAKIEKKGG